MVPSPLHVTGAHNFMGAGTAMCGACAAFMGLSDPLETSFLHSAAYSWLLLNNDMRDAFLKVVLYVGFLCLENSGHFSQCFGVILSLS